MLGRRSHRGKNVYYEWRAPLKDGIYCLPKDGSVHKPPKPRPKAKNEARADDLFGVCAPMPIGGGCHEGRRMQPYWYRGLVIRKGAYKKGLRM